MSYGVTEFVVNSNPLENPSVSISDPRVWDYYETGGSSFTHSGVRVNTRSAMGYPPVWRGVNLISGYCAKIPLVKYERTADNGKIPDVDSAGYRLFRQRASQVMKSRSFMRTLTYHALIYGNGTAAILRDGRDEPLQLLILDPNNTGVRVVDGEVWYFTQLQIEPERTEQIRLPARDVFHVRGLSPDGLWGHSVISLLAEALGVGMAAQDFGARFFGQGSNMSGVLMVPGHFSDEKVRNTINAWDKMHAGLTNAHKIALLQDGVKWQPTTIPPDSAQYLQTRQYEIRGTVANILGIPPHKLGDDTRTSYNSLEAEQNSLLEDSLDDWFSEWESEANDKLLSEAERAADSHLFEFNRNAVLRMDFEKRTEGYSKMFQNGVLSVNDIRRRENMPTIGEDGDERYRPANLVPLGEDEPEPDPPPFAPPLPEPEEPDEETNRSGRMLRNVVAASMRNYLEIERDRVKRAARKPDRFVAWLDTFYAERPAAMSMGGTLPAAPLSEHCEAAKAILWDISASVAPETLAAQVGETMADWPNRAEALTTQLLGA